MKEKTNTISAKPLKQLEDLLDLYLGQKAPALPDNFKETIVSLAPWLIIIMIVLASPAIFDVLGIGTLLAPFSFFGGLRYGATFNLYILLLAVSLIMQVLAVPGLLKRSLKAWRLIFYATLVSAVSALSHGNLGNLIIGTGISLYVLFQVKKYYK